MENTLDKKYSFSGMFWFFAIFSLIKFYDFFFYSLELRNLLIATGFGLMAFAHFKYNFQFDQKPKNTGFYLSMFGACLSAIGIFMRFI